MLIEKFLVQLLIELEVGLMLEADDEQLIQSIDKLEMLL